MADENKIEASAQDAFKNAGAATQKSFQDFSAFGQLNVDALMRAQAVASKAAEELNAEFVAYSKKSMEEGVAHAKSLVGSKTLTEVMDKQAGFARLALDGFVQQSTRMNDLMLDAARGVMEPLNTRMSATSELFKGRTA